MLASIGIVKGQPFTPDAASRAVLDRAARTGYKMSRVIGFEEVVSGRSLRTYPDRRWINPIPDRTPSNPGRPFDLSWRRTAGGYLDLDLRIWFFTDYYSISPGMLSLTPRQGREVHGRLHRQRGDSAVRRRELSPQAAAQHPGR
jgi:hypothetical protein